MQMSKVDSLIQALANVLNSTTREQAIKALAELGED